MSEMEMGFRTAVVGGFQRDDVLKYIEKMAQEHTDELTACRKRLDESEKACAVHKKAEDELAEKNAGLLERLGEQTLALDKARAELEERERSLVMAAEETNLHTERYSDLQQQYQALEAECDELRRQNDALRAQAEEFDRSRTELADIELEARHRVREREQQANEQAACIRAAAEQTAAEIRAEAEQTAGETREQAEKYAESVRAEADAARRDADEYAAALTAEAEEQCAALRAAAEEECARERAAAEQAVEEMKRQMEQMRQACRGAMEIALSYQKDSAGAAAAPCADEDAPKQDSRSVLDGMLHSLRRSGRA